MNCCNECGQIKSKIKEHVCKFTKKCQLCGQFKTKNHSCSFTSSINRNKGVRSYQEVVNYFLALDRARGMSWNKLAKTYKLERKGIKNRIKTYERQYSSASNN